MAIWQRESLRALQMIRTVGFLQQLSTTDDVTKYCSILVSRYFLRRCIIVGHFLILLSAISPHPYEVLAWLSSCSKMQMICMWFSWCHCHPIISCFIKIQNGFHLSGASLPRLSWTRAIKRVCISLSTTVAHNTAQNSSDSLLSHPLDNYLTLLRCCLLHGRVDWLTELWFHVQSLNTKYVISETFPKPISWLGMEKLNLTQQKTHSPIKRNVLPVQHKINTEN